MRNDYLYLRVFLYSIIIQLVILYFKGEPQPFVHDEFSNIFGAETLLKFRLANPPLKFPEFFDTFHLISSPTFTSIYPPGVAFFLAVGKFIFNSYFLGSVLSTVLAAVTFTWMIRGMYSPVVAFYCGIIFNIFPVIIYWTHSYWSGSVGFMGGALMFGVLIRVMKNNYSKQHVIQLLLGLFLLSISRPFEGFIFSVLVFALIIKYLKKNNQKFEPKTMLGFTIGVIFIVGFQAYFNYKTTHKFLLMPHMLYSESYQKAPLFVWQNEREGVELNSRHRRELSLGWELELYKRQHNWTNVQESINVFIGKYSSLLGIYFNFIIVIIFLFGLFNAKNNVFLKTSIGLFLLFILLCTHHFWAVSHYSSPFAPVIFFAILLTLEEVIKIDNSKQKSLSKILIVCMFIAYQPTYINLFSKNENSIWSSYRKRILEELNKKPFNSLVFIDYGNRHSVHQEWVYNTPDIDTQKVILARSFGLVKDSELIKEYKNRKILKLIVNDPEVTLTDY